MLTMMNIKFKMNDVNTYDANMGSIMQGFIMEKISRNFSDKMHKNQFHSYSQYIKRCEGELVWTINTMDSEAKVEIIDKLIGLDNVEIKHRKETLRVEKIYIESMTYEQMFDKFYTKNQPHSIKLKFITPTSFKSGGKDMIYPSVRLIFQNLINRFNLFSKDIGIAKDEFIPVLEKAILLKDYKLSSTTFSLEGVRIPSFCGELVYLINAPQHIVNLVHMLSEFAMYSGIGIKTSIGMGGIRVIHDIRI